MISVPAIPPTVAPTIGGILSDPVDGSFLLFPSEPGAGVVVRACKRRKILQWKIVKNQLICPFLVVG